MEYSLNQLLGLQAFKIEKISGLGKTVVFNVSPRRKTGDCPDCLRRCSRIHGYLKPQTVKHIRIGQRLSFLSLTKRRFDCKNCRKVFSERVDGITYRQRLTDCAKEQILSHLTDRSFRSAKRQTGIGYHSQRRYLTEKIQPFLWDWKEELTGNGDISLGVDEISFSGHDMIRVITNISAKKVKSILPDDTQVSFMAAIGNIPETVRNRITEVAMDLSGNSRAVVEAYLPQARVVADRFHVIQDANQRLSEERTVAQARIGRGFKIPKPLLETNREDLTDEERVKLRRCFTSFPELKFFWEAKERLRWMYCQRNREKAGGILNTLISAMEKSGDRDLKQWARTLRCWHEPILNFFTKRTTNGFTEGANTKLKLIKRISYGFRNKGVFIRKAMLAFLPFAVLTPHLMT